MARKILLADDSVTAQNMGRKILADAGYEVITVNNGSAALKKIGEHRPDLIVLDVYMPGYSGLEVCQRLKDAGETARIPILLTVGKLEPFKPEEAKRVRADAFIVKPFEASELLSALSKLEDKVVPRPESSKPGRFARATAAIDESRFDKSMAVEEDSGWKNRISFPSKKKKEKEQEADRDDPAIYNAVNKDLRTVVDHKPGEHPHTEQAEEHVNVGALAPDGLPKDVTPEEIAALAAAAAQIQGKLGDEKTSEPMAEMPVNAPVEVESAKPEAKEETRAVESAPVPEAAGSEAPVTYAEQKPEEKKQEEKVETASEVTATQAEVSAAVVGLEKEASEPPAAVSGNGSWAPSTAEKTDEPVTMAVAAGAETAALVPRWVAQAVALAPDEASISLEQEMQKAYAAFAAAEDGHSAVVPAIQETAAAPAAVVEAGIPTENAAVESLPEIPAVPAPDAVQPLAAVAEAATEAVSAAVKELEAVATTYEAEAPKASVAEEPTAAVASEPAATVASEPAIVAPEPAPVAASEPAPAFTEAPSAEAKAEEPAVVEPAPEPEAIAKTELIEAKESETKSEESQLQEEPVESKEILPVAEAAAPAAEAVETEKSRVEEISTEPPAGPEVRIAGGIDDMAKRESDTAAAWASWRKISVDKTPHPADSSEESPKDSAAMAVAAGSESSPEDVRSTDESEDIASIVDSVLADMRPKIVEEIAKKLGKKR